MNATTLIRHQFKLQIKKRLADTFTPVSIYLKLRDQYAHTLLLESSDYHSKENSFSFICVDALAAFVAQAGKVSCYVEGASLQHQQLQKKQQLIPLFESFKEQIQVENSTEYAEIEQFNGWFGHTNFDAVQYFETVELDEEKRKFDLPDFRYSFYRFIIAINHFNEELYLLENIPEGQESQLPYLEQLLDNQNLATFPFRRIGQPESNLEDEEFRTMVRAGKEHCARGDVFQLVLSRQFQQDFQGDEFNVYRALRSVNPSPYLFYFDYGTYKIMGSSPEAQLVVRDSTAILTPIAGTYKRTGDLNLDHQKAQELLQDPKENAEHVMLVDLARNDLNRHAEDVQVATYKEVQYYSHVLHLVSKVEGQLADSQHSLQIFADTFPAGTLSGAPKYRALQLINQYENQNRSFYGGAIGFFAMDGSLNQAILIRSFLSYQNTLYYQAGAGIVIDSDEEKELQEVNHKLGALNKALGLAETIL